MDLISSLETFAVVVACYTLYGAIYRVYLSPIASFPGPRLAAVSFWYEFYYDVVKNGRYSWKIEELHKQYGPIIRINPYEIHIIDPEFYDELYVAGGKRKSNLWSWTLPTFGTPDAIIATLDHDIHRRRRNAYDKYFSKQSIRNYSSVIQAAVDKLCLKMRQISKSGAPVNLWHVYSAMTGDVVTGYCFPEAYGLLDEPDCGTDLHNMFMSTLSDVHMLKHFPFLLPLMLSLPQRVTEFLLPDLAHTFRWQQKWVQQINEVNSGMDEGNKARGGKPSIFKTLLDSDLPAHDKSAHRLMQDAQTVVAGGVVTTTASLALATYYILSDEHILETLTNELKKAIPDPSHPLPLVELEQLEYLSAITLETLRISHGVSHRLQRISPDQPLVYQDKIIPAGTPVSMSSIHMHNNPDIFPNPELFKPERWLPLETEGRRLQKYLVAFGRGSRSCLGMNLGTAELYMILAGVFRNLGGSMKIVYTVKERDVVICRDLFTPFPRKDSTGIKVVIDESDS